MTHVYGYRQRKPNVTSDQSFEHQHNRALQVRVLLLNASLQIDGNQISAETKRPVRVIRGPNKHSKYAPAAGYRYDGLYVVEKVCL